MRVTRSRSLRLLLAVVVGVTTSVAVVLGTRGLLTAVPLADSGGDDDRPAVTNRWALRAALDKLTDNDHLPGAVIQVRDGQGSTVTLSSGTAELGSGRPMVDGNARFRIASNSKAFTAVAVLQLVDEGKIGLDAPIERYLPGVVHGTGAGAAIDGNTITVRQILQHTSGLPEYVDQLDRMNAPARWWEPVDMDYSPAHLVSLALAQPPLFAPGTGWAYVNTNYVLAGMLVQAVTGEDIRTVLTERIIAPLGLADTYWPADDELGIRGPHAHNYAGAAAGPGTDGATPARADLTEMTVAPLNSAGSLVSTPGDLNRFYQALSSGQLLSPDSLAEMRTTVNAAEPRFPAGTSYGLGLLRMPLSCGGEYWGHGGNLPGVVSMSGADNTGRQATAYVTTSPDNQSFQHLLDTMDVAFCSAR
ncbi:serine hydrolase domain-containing protein [Goodfellowiella coeruleoviolacea]|uniref:D-alanyl-D-alanine carboxypeptidase n=1 Tax=Goodfellowiella coeruleoviolacea TaxID=334858 RepID=A0AAE3KJ84_9PSEU|nr:serine hydrolase domain-containing protein [Goodfellowiella coeruleoviolacea]MCP2170001.1 D-alanyl-D-alanine carboxypeptidase [Goodfellowiella coeruleoviolacea]